MAQEGTAVGGRRLMEKVAPVYPALARRLNLEGVVKLRVTVSPDGAFKQSEVVGGNPVLAKPAEETPLIAARAVALLHRAGVPPAGCFSPRPPGGRW